MSKLAIALFAMFSMAALPAAAADKSKSEIGYPAGSLGYKAMLSADYDKAERQLLNNDSAPNDPARLLNLGRLYQLTGRTDEARAMYERTLRQDDMDLILANGSSASSHQLATTGLHELGGR